MSAGHGHGHAHGHGHDHGAASANRTRLAIALGITATIFIAEVIGAHLTNSLALLVDAAHMFTDSVGLVVAFLAATLMTRPASAKRTWGWQRAEVIAASGQAAVLLVVGGYAVYEGVTRLLWPPEVFPGGLALIGLVGLLGNLASLLVLSGGRSHNLNMRAAFLEVANDALGSVAVLVAAGVIALTGWMRADAVAGLAVAALILPRALRLLRESGAILLESTPEGLDLDTVRAHILGLPHVVGVHDLHASTVASGLPVLTAHVVLDDECFTDGHSLELLADVQRCMAEHHGVSIEHCTLQLESAGIAHEHLEHLHA
ncbi:cation diffusion facilitator family transporter [Gephyromycinifex aptenodytis]|uniref:cation diffusion facilitator family transporter n=1 Tax=Gephyromycinifex aptenodytis TaxID=2716227 RepID=UPI001447B774|nr:cation diffusion facilitator family transporter [Gephyromycinifex aptenodytis]